MWPLLVDRVHLFLINVNVLLCRCERRLGRAMIEYRDETTFLAAAWLARSFPSVSK